MILFHGIDGDEIAAGAEMNALHEAVRLIEAGGKCVAQREPQAGMVMLVHRDGVETSPFNMGEVLVTRAEADFNGILGFGCVVGDEPERAWCAAVIDAWLESHPDPAHPAAGVLEKEALRYLARRQEEDRMVGATKVRFDVKP